MNPDDQLNTILNTIEARMCDLFDLPASSVFEYRRTGEHEGAALYISAAITSMEPLGPCTEDATVEVVLGFHIPRHETLGDRVYRIQRQSALRDRLVFAPGHPDQIPNIKLVKTNTMGVTFGDDPDENHLMGGITIEFHTALRRIAAG